MTRELRLVLIGIAIGVAVLGAAGLAYAFGWRIGDDGTTPAAAASVDAEQQVECATIKHAYETWVDRNHRLVGLGQYNASLRQVYLDQLTQDGEAFYNAARGYSDQPSKKLTVAAATYKAELGMIALEQQLGGGFKTETLRKAVDAWDSLKQGYREFNETRCGG